ncbi:hypothetical protein [Aquirhabdus parva]|uniref:Uncharacterized protein n=1 Tax=Aquirhabdus parva TaxID=2283318 RepID=A0A345PAN9_9GAMM|nr:hypothetical protein [Aquirhabdus parva]AXI04348.1 hypothetical protein HYN46_16800 [Aquirhabdus parva]AXI04392.1 hypothetical protein HYN46_17045 [Aquirhabdus parva]
MSNSIRLRELKIKWMDAGITKPETLEILILQDERIAELEGAIHKVMDASLTDINIAFLTDINNALTELFALIKDKPHAPT